MRQGGMMTLFRAQACAALLAVTCCPSPAKAFVPMRRGGPSNVVDRRCVDDLATTRDAAKGSGFLAGSPLPSIGSCNGIDETEVPLPRAPSAKGHAEASGGTVCPLRLYDIFYMIEVGLCSTPMLRRVEGKYILAAVAVILRSIRVPPASTLLCRKYV